MSKVGLLLGLMLSLLALEGRAAAFPVVFEASQRAVLSADRSGTLDRVVVSEGSVVKKGALLARLGSAELVLLRKRQEASLRFLNGQLTNAVRLRKNGLAGLDEENRARMERDLSRADLKILKRQISESSIRAPFAATVVAKLAKAHEWVQEGQPVVELVNTHRLRAVANVDVAAAVLLKRGDQHRFQLPDLRTSVLGKVTALVPDVDVRSNTMKVMWQIETQPQGLLAGMKGTVELGN
ncbi:MAG: efflux RND transporter periplasmic adaptor subunit [Gammaproteobacteria bacterium]|nr:efflux RND transporter periplasmic adaptor subunit [Gammaproteobacteria bacterium]